jgi:hypothetical protein
MREAIERAETALFADEQSPLFSWQPDDLAVLAREAGLSGVEVETRRHEDTRRLGNQELRAWVLGRADDAGGAPAPEPHSYAAHLAAELSPEELEELAAGLARALSDRDIAWPTTVAYLSASAGTEQ